MSQIQLNIIILLLSCLSFVHCYLSNKSLLRVKPIISYNDIKKNYDSELSHSLVGSSIIFGQLSNAATPIVSFVNAALISAIVRLGFIKSADAFIPPHIHASPHDFGMIIGLILFIGLLKENKSSPYDDIDEEEGVLYNADRANRFYKLRPHLVAKRLFSIAWLALSFNLSLLIDWKFGNIKRNEEKRADQALRMLTRMGPTFIKLGQALSIRTDLIPVAYAKAFKKLQDAVPAFDSILAKQIVCRELKISHLGEKFRTFSAEPVAAASIGQVYKATLLNGKEVAVKVSIPM